VQEAHRKTVTLVLGGVRSGKSRFAQQIARKGSKVVFIATAKPIDDEMRMRIARHRQSRPQQWSTMEVPLDLDAAVANLRDEQQLAIVDCLTVYLANVMSEVVGDHSAIRESIDRLCAALREARSPLVLVSNEVGSGVHAPTALGRHYCELLGELNQRVAEVADNVVFMVAGVPLAVKGQLPPHEPPQVVFGHERPGVVEQSAV
jgi:adenosylcobinamide kinase / adenosylcobinamide-phosphate guanylyltransferase